MRKGQKPAPYRRPRGSAIYTRSNVEEPSCPRLRPERVSPSSALRLIPSAKYVVGTLSHDGILIRSQHEGIEAARRTRQVIGRASGEIESLTVYRIERRT